MAENLVYVGRDLEAMSFATTYHTWILDVFSPYLGKRIVEVGAGTGSFSAMIAARKPESLVLVEPSIDMHRLLQARVKALNTDVPITTYNALFRSVASQIHAEQQPDTIIYVNVLEHVEDDQKELEIISQTLAPGGRVLIFVPAFQWLYSNFDRAVGHLRRYTRTQLRNQCEKAGFKVLKSIYFDFPGVAVWWMKYRLLGSETMEPGLVRLYDRLIVPPLKQIESLAPPLLGKNVVLIAEKEAAKV